MSKPKLTAAQRAVIQKMKEGYTLTRGYQGKKYFIHDGFTIGGMKFGFLTVHRLLNAGYIAYNQGIYQLTSAGRALDL